MGHGFAAFSAALMRLRQPGPVARNFSSTSASSRMVVETFGCASRGRPYATGAASNFAFRPRKPPRRRAA